MGAQTKQPEIRGEIKRHLLDVPFVVQLQWPCIGMGGRRNERRIYVLDQSGPFVRGSSSFWGQLALLAEREEGGRKKIGRTC